MADKDRAMASFLYRLAQTWKPTNRIRLPLYTKERQSNPKHPLLLGEEWADIELIMRDCPWRYLQRTSKVSAHKGEPWGRKHKGLPIYDCMDIGAIAELPLERIAAKNAILLDWVTFPKLDQAIEAVEFRRNKNGNPIWTYKACPFVWVKTTSQAKRNLEKVFKYKEKNNLSSDWFFEWITGTIDIPGLPGFWHKGNGFYSMANVEVCLLYTKGSPSFRQKKDVGQLIIEPVGKHSSKPRGIYTKIDRLFGTERKRAELFARKVNAPPEGWLATGLDYDGVDICKALGMDRRFWYENQPKFDPRSDGGDGEPE